ncbi:pyridoxal phosphate-dependent transferase [Fimicolochytrium jonesii]|uniref:pyridoxal phosphate-dependent transferase n=1 Tax=Fimicolochytrium jonesii TaxID=1396493 RepID=UPI0022FE1779|nr:pyridoxal phosphate-dependent transferase [Fimicolochytrium jonesii]KAI8821750.1 pyridoxal phosphate-dependent transferase [Fimicolochytrium jonesii]
MSAHGPASFRALLPTFQIYSANTGVGKTLLSAAICRAAVKAPRADFEATLCGNRKREVFYIKPVQTGYPEDSDARHVKQFCPDVHATTLFTYREPAGPHLCAERENRPISDLQLLDATTAALNTAYTHAHTLRSPSLALLETAGGVTSPVMSGTPQASAFRPLRLPSLLIGDAQLGGISTTLSSYESLLLRGYDIAAVLLFDNPRYNNHLAIQRQIDAGVPLHVFPPPPPMPVPKDGKALSNEERLRDFTDLMVWYEGLGVADEVVRGLLAHHSQRLDRLEHLAKRGEEKVWWPFTQHRMVKETTVIDSAYGDSFALYNPLKTLSDNDGVATPSPDAPPPNTPQSGALETPSQAPTAGSITPAYDACASWWTQSLGHAPHSLTLTAAHTSARYGHVIFPECIHEPAYALASTLLRTVGKGWGERVFYTDNGSTGVEVALKAAQKVVEKRLEKVGKGDVGREAGRRREMKVVGMEGGYHGDTIGAMDAANPNTYNEEINWYKPRGLWFTPPTITLKNGRYTIRLPPSLSGTSNTSETFPTLTSLFAPTRSPALATLYEHHITAALTPYLSAGNIIGSVLLEPLLLGAGGMQFIDPLFQRTLLSTVSALTLKHYGIPTPTIFDEVFVGFHRLGLGIASPGAQLLGQVPDIAVYAKNMSGGIVPVSATVVTGEVYESFLGESKKEAMLHGHSYTAAAVGCAVAEKALGEYEGFIEGVVKGDGGEYGQGEEGRHVLPETVGGGVWDEEFITTLSHHPRLDGVLSLGSVLILELSTAQKGYNSTTSSTFISALRSKGVFARPLGNVVYIMAPHVAVVDASVRRGVRRVEAVLREVLGV